MDSLRIDIINPKALNLLKDLADMDLIRIKGKAIKPDFAELLDKIRKDEKGTLSFDEITAEVESVRKARYE